MRLIIIDGYASDPGRYTQVPGGYGSVSAGYKTTSRYRATLAAKNRNYWRIGAIRKKFAHRRLQSMSQTNNVTMSKTNNFCCQRHFMSQ